MTKKEKAFYFGKLHTLLAFMHDVVPLLLFGYVFRYYQAWDPAFNWAAIGAFVFIVLLFTLQLKVEKFFIGINGFFMGGALLLWLAPDNIANMYLNNLSVSLFIFVFIVGLILTYTARTGFIGFEGVKPQAKIIRLSHYMLAGFAVAAVFSYFFVNDMITGAAVPWLGLIAFRRLLK